MARLFRKIIIFFSVLSVLVIALYFVSGYLTRNHRLGTTIDKHQRLARIAGPRIIVLGGSAVHYGLDSRLLEKLTGFPVVNMGTQGSVGMIYYFNEVLPALRNGDIVIFAAEIAHFRGHLDYGEETLYVLLSKYPSGLNYINTKQWLNFPGYVGVAIRENIEYLPSLIAAKLIDKPTIRDKTNQWGDYVGHEQKTSNYTTPVIRDTNEVFVNKRSISFLQSVQAKIEAKGANFYIVYSPVDKAYINQYLVSDVDRVIPVAFPDNHLGSVYDHLWPTERFYDTPNHLLYRWRESRTLLLYQQLLNANAI